ncbi:restriction endonuclease subunit S [Anabaena cylindrica FACHB-243]|uniref:Restriction modification system DNA specificity domain protein n=1 Tax=Anabaena cylindrica (strain ATCC 27899 / PCC 7122) TaxID=272123 RepID=K9ZQ81_ANACC|nr:MULTISPECIES: restriction endonuclease subunit S [Anabaena]AFZ61331.1 restriction modification system DNA specificity domain protein [Anabaena cylindrica PCC 7122]MBD2420161.1 restriction endonuclease subunit S [Anabaena cylindrica FACHB-243]MBY5282180.1 restriction endonuclease subunit S [Anabaena sp. CCAP 1446/1C]MBY5309431.1 restriction endonuclease subunit S [Anabaena sp. CCAP 1446/1C]MCM2409272.1 restriction endonuclease subunit S [Anabaena sp. CCAP 1446/1C]
MSEWKIYKIDQLKSSHKTAISIGPFGSRMKSDCYVLKGIPVIRGNNISDTPNFIGDFVFIAEEQAKDYKSSKVYKNDLVFPHRGNIGEAGIVTENQYKEYIISSSLMKLSCNTDLVYPKFLYYFFKSNQGRKKLLENASQVGTPGIATPLTSLKNIEINLPLLEEQKRIADILSCLDAKIENLRRQNETLEQIAQTLFKHWFIDFDFPNADGKPYKSSGGEMSPSELGDIPEGWRVGKFSTFFDLFSGGTPKTSISEYWSGSIKWLSAKDVTRNHKHFVIETEKTITSKGLQKSAAKLLPIYTTVVSARGTVGNYCLLSEEMAISQSNFGVYPKSSNQVFFGHLLMSSLIERLKSQAYGSVFDTVTASTFNELYILIPELNVAEDFENKIKLIFHKILLNEKQIKTLTKTRDALLPKLMSGQLRVKE